MAQEKKEASGKFDLLRRMKEIVSRNKSARRIGELVQASNWPLRIMAVLIIFILIASLSVIFRIILTPLAISPRLDAMPIYTQGVLGEITAPPEPSLAASDLKNASLLALAGRRKAPPPPDRQKMLSDLSRIFGRIPFVSTALGALAEFTPILLALYFLQGDPRPEIKRLLNFSKFLALVHFSIYFLPATNNLLGSGWFDEADNFIRGILQRILQTAFIPLDTGFNIGGRYLGVAVLGILLPFVIRGWLSRFHESEAMEAPKKEGPTPTDKEKQDDAPPLENTARINIHRVDILFLLVLALCIVLPIYAIINSGLGLSGCGAELNRFLEIRPLDLSQLFTPDLLVLVQAVACARPIWGWVVLLAGGVLALLIRWLLGLGTRSLGQKIASGWLWVAALLILGISVGQLPTLWNYDFSTTAHLREGKLWFAMAILLGLTLSFSLAWAAYRGLHSVMQWKKTLPSQALWLAAGILTIFSIPTLALVDRGEPLGRISDIYQLAYRLDDLLIFLWTAAVLYVLYLDGKDKGDLNISASSRHLAMLSMGVFLFGLSGQFLYIPVAFLFGYVLLWWATDQPPLPKEPKEDPGQLREWIRTFSLVRLSEQLYGGIRRENTKKLAKGESKLSEFFTSMEEYEKAKGEKEVNLLTWEDGSRINPLAFGPHTEAWSNGIHGLTWSLIFALPWIIIYVFSFLAETEFNITFPLLSFVVDLLTLVGFWAAIGFVMGYFFPSLRGSSGLQKGLILGLVLIVARMPLNLAYNREFGEWQAILLLSMQIFIQCMLLGLLAFDYYVLNKWHFSFQQLLEIHGLSGLGIWVSTLIVAIGAAITPLLATGTQAAGVLKLFVTAVGKIIGVDLGNVEFTP